VPITLIKDRHE